MELKGLQASRIAVLVIICLVSISCSVSHRQVSLEIPDEFSQSGPTLLEEQWWTVFEDPELNRLVTRALSRNPDMLSAWDRLDQVTALAGMARAGRFPMVQAEFGATRTDVETGDSSDAAGSQFSSVLGPRDGTSYSVSLSASYELDLWGRVRAAHKASLRDLAATAEDVQTTAISLSSSVVLTWFELKEKSRQLKVLKDQIEVNGTYLELLEARYQQGLVSAADVLQQRQQLAATRSEVPMIEARRAVLEHQLAILTGEPPQQYRVSSEIEDLPELPGFPATGVPAELLARRPDVRSMQYRLEAADYRVAEAVANRLPRLSIVASFSDTQETVSSLFENWLLTLIGNLTTPIFDAGRLSREVDRTEAAASERLHTLTGVLLNAFREVEDALILEQKQSEFVLSLHSQLELSRETLQVTQHRYMSGITDYLPVLNALQVRQRLERQYIESQRILLTYRVNLYKALGGGWDLERPEPGSTTPAQGRQS